MKFERVTFSRLSCHLHLKFNRCELIVSCTSLIFSCCHVTSPKHFPPLFSFISLSAHSHCHGDDKKMITRIFRSDKSEYRVSRVMTIYQMMCTIVGVRHKRLQCALTQHTHFTSHNSPGICTIQRRVKKKLLRACYRIQLWVWPCLWIFAHVFRNTSGRVFLPAEWITPDDASRRGHLGCLHQ